MSLGALLRRVVARLEPLLRTRLLVPRNGWGCAEPKNWRESPLKWEHRWRWGASTMESLWSVHALPLLAPTQEVWLTI